MAAIFRVLAFSLTMVTVAATTAGAAEPYYAGKTITVLIASPPGGGPDLACRILVQYMPNHIAGHPTMVPKNMYGAASIIPMNYMGLEAKKDGTVVVCGVPAPANQLTGNGALKVDLRTFDYVLGEGGPYVMYMRKDTAPGINTPADVFKAQNLVLGGSQISSGHDIGELLLLDALGLKFRYVTGLNGDSLGRNAIQQKFINMYMETITGYQQMTVPILEKTGEIIPLFQDGLPDAQGHLTLRDPRLPDLQTFREFYQAHFGKPPAGPKVDLAERQIGMIAVALSVLALPPGVSKEASAAMHAAVEPLNHDAEFIAAAEKIRGPGVQELPGDVAKATIEAYLDMPPDVRATFNHLIQVEGDMSKMQ